MWNQILNTYKLPYYSYQTKKKEEIAKHARYKLFLLLISRATYRVLKNFFIQIQKINSKQEILFQKLCNYCTRNLNTVQKILFQKLKQNAIIQRVRQNSIKNVVILLQRIGKYKIKKTFSLIVLCSQRKNQKIISNIEQIRKFIFYRKIQKIFKQKRKEYLNNIVQYSYFSKKLQNKVKRVGNIGAQYVKNIKQVCFNRLTKNLYLKKIASTSSGDKPKQKESLQKKLDTMSIQLLNKNVSISKLEHEIEQLKMQQPSSNYNSFSEYTACLGGNFNHQKNRSLSKKMQNESVDSGFNFSLGSILGNSFSLNKTKSKELKKREDSIASIDCNCNYKKKYIKIKNSNQSLKNQLEIVKEELDVAKDLNDHFTNEIKLYFGGQKDVIELDRLKKEVKDLHKQKDQMRIKIIKYQNHINTLKSEFKLKIEELYRKVKKQR